MMRDEWFMTGGGVCMFFGIVFAVWLAMLVLFTIFLGSPGFIVGHIVGLCCIPAEGWLMGKIWKPN